MTSRTHHKQAFGDLRVQCRWLEENVYLTWHIKIQQVLGAEFDAAEAYEVAKDDWERDCIKGSHPYFFIFLSDDSHNSVFAFSAGNEASHTIEGDDQSENGTVEGESMARIGYGKFYDAVFELADTKLAMEQGGKVRRATNRRTEPLDGAFLTAVVCTCKVDGEAYASFIRELMNQV